MSWIKAQKTLILLDTCHSGSYVKSQLIPSQRTKGIEQIVATEKLIRATGRAVISASTDTQAAFEGYKGHGVFTYALLQALKYADKEYGNKDKLISTAEIASYVNEKVPEITYSKWGYEQVPQSNLHGREFPISIAP